MLDPTLARTYVGRIVFASLCDKLFDIDEKLEHRAAARDRLTSTSADGKTVTIKLRPGVKFHDGEPIDAEAVEVQPRPPPDDAGLVPQARARAGRPASRWSIR